VHRSLTVSENNYDRFRRAERAAGAAEDRISAGNIDIVRTMALATMKASDTPKNER
jgi:hypothetical protein